MKKLIFVLLTLFNWAGLHAASHQWQWIGPPAGTIQQIIPDRKNPNVWYSVNNGVLYRSTNGAKSWNVTPLSNLQDPYDTSVAPVVVDSESSNLFVANQKPGGSRLWFSEDQGKSFQLRGSFHFKLRRVIPHPTDPNVLYGFGLNDLDLAVSVTGGRSWENVSNLPFTIGQPVGNCEVEALEFVDFVFSPFNSNVLFASALVLEECIPESDEFSILIMSDNGGKTWKVLEKGSDYGYTFHTDPLFPKRVIASNHDGLKILTPQGWKVLSSQQDLLQVISVPGHPEELLGTQRFFAGSYKIRVFKSKDGGKSWNVAPLGLEGKISKIQSVDDSTRGLLAGTNGAGLYYRNQENSWQQRNRGFLEADITQIQTPASGDRIYASSRDFGNSESGYLFTTEAMKTVWENLSFLLPGNSGTFDFMTVDPGDSQHLLIASKSISGSENGGKKWISSNMTPIECCQFAVAFDPGNPNVVYAARDGAFKSTDGGKNFQQLSATNLPT
ncbi:MAG TPA: hypothetical protein VH815_12340, partial [Acidobacteriota bacterium]